MGGGEPPRSATGATRWPRRTSTTAPPAAAAWPRSRADAPLRHRAPAPLHASRHRTRARPRRRRLREWRRRRPRGPRPAGRADGAARQGRRRPVRDAERHADAHPVGRRDGDAHPRHRDDGLHRRRPAAPAPAAHRRHAHPGGPAAGLGVERHRARRRARRRSSSSSSARRTPAPADRPVKLVGKLAIPDEPPRAWPAERRRAARRGRAPAGHPRLRRLQRDASPRGPTSASAASAS